MKRLLSLLLAFLLTGAPAFASTFGRIELKPSSVQTYHANSTMITMAGSPTDIFTIFGSSTKTIVVRYIECSVAGSGTGAMQLYLVKRSTTNSGGTSASMTTVPVDSANNATTATNVLQYTANPASLGTTVGAVSFTTLGQGVTGNVVLYDWTKSGQALTLRGTSQGLAVNGNGNGTANAGAIQCKIFYTEE